MCGGGGGYVNDKKEQVIFLLMVYIKIIVKYTIIIFPVSLRKRLISGGLEPVLNHNEKLCIAWHYIQFSTNTKCTFINQFFNPRLKKLGLIL